MSWEVRTAVWVFRVPGSLFRVSCFEGLVAKTFLFVHFAAQVIDNLTKQLYILSGLGADERVFQHLDFSGHQPTFIKWIDPNINETIGQYATRLSAQITSLNPILIGLSFGGIMAIEIAKQIGTEKVILISSAKTRNEIPFYYHFAGLLRIHRLLPPALLRNSGLVTNWFFGATSKIEKQLLKQILQDTEPTFLKWAINQIVCWTNQTTQANVLHIHGTRDRILPFRYVNCDQKIKGGGHLMILNKSEEINTLLRNLLQTKS
jgi:pimeloyl-ACP methyl ester carboxylesterase